MEKELPRTLLEAVRYFSDEQRAFDFVVSLRWTDAKPVCPDCGSLEQSFISTRRLWKCKACKRQFSVRVGTIFEDSPISFSKWLPCIWLIANSKNSISSYEVARSVGVTQKTAWFMLHRIRRAMEEESFERLSGEVEVDETYVGGSARNMHTKRHRGQPHGGSSGKIAIQGARERGGRVVAGVLNGTTKSEMQTNVRFWVAGSSSLYTDEHPNYTGLDTWFAHKTVNHSSRTYVSGNVSTNGIENFWSIFKRSLKGTQVHMSQAHAGRYVTERVFAFNYRDESDLTRMALATAGTVDRRLTWRQLTTKRVLPGWPTY